VGEQIRLLVALKKNLTNRAEFYFTTLRILTFLQNGIGLHYESNMYRPYGYLTMITESNLAKSLCQES